MNLKSVLFLLYLIPSIFTCMGEHTIQQSGSSGRIMQRNSEVVTNKGQSQILTSDHQDVSIESKYLAECLDNEQEVASAVGHLNTFTTVGTSECWMYCKFTLSCEALTFNFLEGSCSLFNDQYKLKERESGDTWTMAITVLRSCMELKQTETSHSPGLSSEDALSLTLSGEGVLIQQDFIKELLCLTKGSKLFKGKKGKGDKRFSLIWTPCEGADKWLVHEVGNTDKSGTEFFQFSLANQADLCLDTDNTSMQHSRIYRAILNNCREIQQVEANDSQVMYLTRSGSQTSDILDLSYSIFSKSLETNTGIKTLFTVDTMNIKKALTDVRFKDPADYPAPQPPCPLSQFSLSNGTFQNEHDLPFFLPGHQVTVRCNEGYKVADRNCTDLQVIPCEENSTPRPCKLAECSISDQDKLYAVMLAVTVVSSVSAVVLLVLQAVGWRRKKSGEN